jgi:uncharacterized protein (TIGR03086 family)
MMEPELDQALKGTLAILTKVQPRDLNAATPCASWDVRALVNHFVGTARWWAATIAGSGDGGDEDYTAGDFVAAYEESIRIAVAAFGADGALARTVRLPFGGFPGSVLLGLAAMEQFTHGWDLARATGQPAERHRPGHPPDPVLRRSRPGRPVRVRPSPAATRNAAHRDAVPSSAGLPHRDVVILGSPGTRT